MGAAAGRAAERKHDRLFKQRFIHRRETLRLPCERLMNPGGSYAQPNADGGEACCVCSCGEGRRINLGDKRLQLR